MNSSKPLRGAVSIETARLMGSQAASTDAIRAILHFARRPSESCIATSRDPATA